MVGHSRRESALSPAPAARERRPGRRRLAALAILAAGALGLAAVTAAAPATASGVPAQPDLGPNVLVFDPSMPTSQIQAAVDGVSAQKLANQFGTQR